MEERSEPEDERGAEAADAADAIDAVAELCAAGEIDRAWRELRRAKRLLPGDPEVREWEATLLAEEERFAEALALAEEILVGDPGSYPAASLRCEVLMELGRFEDALAGLEAMASSPDLELEPDEEAWIHFEKGRCLDRLEREEEADREFELAAQLAPDECPLPPRLSPGEFDALVEEALDSIAPEFDPYLQQVAVAVQDYPPADAEPFLLGLYVGVPRTERAHDEVDHLDRVFIFKRNLETEFPGREALREEIRKTVIHEIAHHFGFGEEDMGEYA
jgi:predicted Zn-dependent protease with MMP-like domain/Flp pilus assembly protein TadD